MKRSEKIDYLQDKHLKEWVETRIKVKEELSRANTIFCVCGKLATGMHESSCSRLRNKITNEVLKRLSYLIEEGK